MDINKEVVQIRKRLSDSTELSPVVICDYLNKLSVWLATFGRIRAEKEQKFEKIKEKYLTHHPETSVARANTWAKTQREFLEKEDAKILYQSIQENIRSLKKNLKILESEKEVSSNF